MTFREIADILAARITSGQWPPDFVLPTTDEIRREFDVSEATAYRALVLLIDRGLVRGVRGGRRYVVGPAE